MHREAFSPRRFFSDLLTYTFAIHLQTYTRRRRHDVFTARACLDRVAFLPPSPLEDVAVMIDDDVDTQTTTPPI